MPILFMALLALLIFFLIGALLCLAVVSESRQREKMERQQAATRKSEQPELVHR